MATVDVSVTSDLSPEAAWELASDLKRFGEWLTIFAGWKSEVPAEIEVDTQVSSLIKVKGFQVAPAEIEAVLHSHPAVQDCAVFGIPDPATGEAIVAAVSAAGPVDAAELIEIVGERLASYKRPNDVVFVPHIPRLPSGKVLRRVLKERYGRTTDQ